VLAHLRIGGYLTIPTARLATGLPGSALTGRDSHPLDDKQDFKRSAIFILPDQPCLVALHHFGGENVDPRARGRASLLRRGSPCQDFELVSKYTRPLLPEIDAVRSRFQA